MTLLLTNEEIESLLTLPECFAALESAYREVVEGSATPGTRSDTVCRTTLEDAAYQLKVMSSVVESLSVGAIRINSDILTWPIRSGNRRRVKEPLAPGGRWTGLVLLFSSSTGEPLAIFPDGMIQVTRVAVTTALGIKYMARENARTMGLIGAGDQARSHVLAAAAVRDIQHCRVFSPTASKRDAFCQQLQKTTGIRMSPVVSAEEAVCAADIVICATNALDTVFWRDWIEPGMHITSIQDKGASEIDPAAIMAADVIAVHERGNMSYGHVTKTSGVTYPDEGGDLTVQPELGCLANERSLGEVISGKKPGRESNDQVTCFLNYRGLGIQFAALGWVAYNNAIAQNRGRDLPTEWFTEAISS